MRERRMGVVDERRELRLFFSLLSLSCALVCVCVGVLVVWFCVMKGTLNEHRDIERKTEKGGSKRKTNKKKTKKKVGHSRQIYNARHRVRLSTECTECTEYDGLNPKLRKDETGQARSGAE